MNTPILPGAAFGLKEMPNSRGTGTYFPNPNTNHYQDRSLNVRGWNQGPIRCPRNNSHADTNWSVRGDREMPQAQCYVHQSAGKSGSSDSHHFESPDLKAHPYTNGLTHPPETVIETLQSPRTTSLESSSRQLNPSLNGGNPSERQKSLSGMDQDRIAVQSYCLKDEEDFPPL